MNTLQIVATIAAIILMIFGIITAKSEKGKKAHAAVSFCVGIIALWYAVVTADELQHSAQPEEKIYEEVETFPVGWADSAGGRPAYTIDEINFGILGDSVILNSIQDGDFGHEFNFVGASKTNDIDTDSDFIWHTNVIQTTEDNLYYVRAYVHNNSPLGYDAVAENVTVRFEISDTIHVTGNDISLLGFDSSNGYYAVAVYGLITASNARPREYADGIKFVSSRPFHLEYLQDSAVLQNNAIGSERGYPLGNNIMIDGVLIGYDTLNGDIPGCYQYSAQARITVVPIFDD